MKATDKSEKKRETLRIDWRKLTARLLLVVLILYAAVHLLLVQLEINGLRAEIERAEERLSVLKERHEVLKEQRHYVETDSFIVERAREDLGLTEADEILYIIERPLNEAE